MAGKTKNPCTICGEPGIPGIYKGMGKCQYHWNEGVFGKKVADEAKKREEERRGNQT